MRLEGRAVTKIVVPLREKGLRRPAGDLIRDVAEELREKHDNLGFLRLKKYKQAREKITLEYDMPPAEGLE